MPLQSHTRIERLARVPTPLFFHLLLQYLTQNAWNIFIKIHSRLLLLWTSTYQQYFCPQYSPIISSTTRRIAPPAKTKMMIILGRPSFEVDNFMVGCTIERGYNVIERETLYCTFGCSFWFQIAHSLTERNGGALQPWERKG